MEGQQGQGPGICGDHQVNGRASLSSLRKLFSQEWDSLYMYSVMSPSGNRYWPPRRKLSATAWKCPPRWPSTASAHAPQPPTKALTSSTTITMMTTTWRTRTATAATMRTTQATRSRDVLFDRVLNLADIRYPPFSVWLARNSRSTTKKDLKLPTSKPMKRAVFSCASEFSFGGENRCTVVEGSDLVRFAPAQKSPVSSILPFPSSPKTLLWENNYYLILLSCSVPLCSIWYCGVNTTVNNSNICTGANTSKLCSASLARIFVSLIVTGCRSPVVCLSDWQKIEDFTQFVLNSLLQIHWIRRFQVSQSVSLRDVTGRCFQSSCACQNITGSFLSVLLVDCLPYIMISSVMRKTWWRFQRTLNLEDRVSGSNPHVNIFW